MLIDNLYFLVIYILETSWLYAVKNYIQTQWNENITILIIVYVFRHIMYILALTFGHNNLKCCIIQIYKRLF